jgi:thymidylate synthase
VNIDGTELDWYYQMAEELVNTKPFHTGEVHAQDTSANPQAATFELMDVRIMIPVRELEEWRILTGPNLPWADEHFAERVGGAPLNPSPSHERWPFARAGNSQHTDEAKQFSHTYPERFWPKYAGDYWSRYHMPAHGIRYQYGDLQDLVAILAKNPMSRQAYLPIWFPEDLHAAGGMIVPQRVPCTIGYHFMYRGGKLHCWYTMRSCDFIRYLRDDIYMAGRLMQWVCDQVNDRIDKEPGRMGEYGMFEPGTLHLTISSLHAFVADKWLLDKMVVERWS